MNGRVPIVRQMNSFECGAACLAMILGYFGRKTRIDECRRKCDPGRNGVTAQTLAAAAGRFGLRTRAFSLRTPNFENVTLPCIAHWNRNHFVVVEHCSAAGVEIADPDLGRRHVSRKELESSFSGTVLQFEPGPEFNPRRERSPSPLWAYLRGMLQTPGTGRIVGYIVLASLVLQALGFALPLLTREMVDRLLPLRMSGEMNMLLMGAVLVALVNGITAGVRANLLVRLETRLDYHLMVGFFAHLLNLPYRFFQMRSSGDLLMRLGSNATIREALASCGTSSLLDGSLVLVFLLALLRISLPFGIAVLLFALVQVAILLGSSRRLHALTENNIVCQSASQSCLAESLIGISTLKASGAEQSTLRRWTGLLAAQLDSSYERGRYLAGVEAAMTAVRTLSPLFLLWFGGTLVLKGSMTVGTMLAVNSLAAVLLQPIASLVVNGQRLQLAGAHLERIADVMEAATEQDFHRVQQPPALTGGIELRAVSFRYDTSSPDVLHDISLSIRAGQKVALVGRTGSGKSTLAKLLIGLYAPSAGEIKYDGLPLHSLNLQSLRRQWGVALQEPFLYSCSLRQNIALYNPDQSQAGVARAARIAEIHTDIMQMPMGYETRIDECGQSLSGGQRQRIAIARAVAGNPRFLLLDEATSHLDTLTEIAVDRNLDSLRCTRVVIAHRLSTIQNADQILVIEDGRIVERGAHAQLLAQGGHYKSLVRSQPDRPTDAAKAN